MILSDLALVVPAAGRGTRLQPVTTSVPKGMVPLAERPILEYVLAVGARLALDRIVLIVNPDGDAIRNHFGDSFEGIPIRYVVQDEPKGLTHAVSLASPFVHDRMLILLSDELYLGCRHDLLCEYFAERRAEGICGFVRTQDEERIRRNYGIALDDSFRITRLKEKPQSTWNDLQGTGTWYFTRDLFDYIARTAPHPTRHEPDFVAVIQEMINDGRRIFGMDLEGSYLNINSADDLSAAMSSVAS